jgi:hypothetical protein
VLVYLLLFTSGSVLYNQSPNKYLVIALVFSLVAWFLFTEKRINERFVLYACIFAGFQFVISLYTEGSLSLPSVISLTAKLVFAYLVLQTLGRNLTDTFVVVVVILAAFSLVGYIIDYYGLFGAFLSKLPSVGEEGYEGILYLFGYDGARLHRNSSIFFEPGAYQGYLNAALFMLLFVKTVFSASRRWLFVLILVMALFTTFSTTGFLIFSIMFGLFLLRGKMLSTSGKSILVGVALASLAVFSAKFHSVIVVKIDDYLSGDEEAHGYSADRRRYDARVDLKIFKKHIFGIGHRKYHDEFVAIGNIGGGSSNGVTRILAVYGLPFGLFVFGSYYWAFRKLLGRGVISVTAFGMFIMFLMGESYFISAPISLAIVAGMFVYNSTSAWQFAETELEVTS